MLRSRHAGRRPLRRQHSRRDARNSTGPAPRADPPSLRHDDAAMRPSLNILEPELIGRIVDEARRVLAEHGFEIRGAEMRRRLIEAGLPQRADGRILFPRDVVEAAIASAPSSFRLFDRDGSPRADIGDDRVHFIPGSSGLKMLDHRTGESRLATSVDFAEYIRLGD